MKILNVLTVEDELPMRQELESYPWEAWGCIHVASCSNGKEALDFCRGYQVDVVISDITMPLMDGLELTRILRQELPGIKILLLTCHENFSYVQEAIRLEAVDYIVKIDLCDEVLCQAIDKIRGKLDKDQLLLSGQKNRQRYQLTKLLAEYASARRPLTDMEVRIQKEAGYTLPRNGFDFFLFVKSNARHWLFVQEELSVFLEENQLLLDWFVIEAGLYFISLRVRTPATLAQFMEALSTYLGQQTYLDIHPSQIYAYSPGEKISFSDILHLLDDPGPVNRYHFYYPAHKMIQRKDLFPCHPVSPEITGECYSLLNARLAHPQELIGELEQFSREKLLEPREFLAMLTGWLENLTKSRPDESRLLPRLQDCQTLDSALELVSHYLQGDTVAKNRHEIKLAMDLIQQKYASPLSLTYVAEQVGLSAPYFSKIFHAELGESFNEYLTRTRMEQAHRLITSSNKKMYEIAELVGIPNYRYFSKLYKAWKENHEN